VILAIFRAFDHQGGADHLIGRGYVQQHRLFFSRCDHDWGRREAMLKVIERGLRLFCPSKIVRLSEEPIKGESLFA
jgi:hypothetical protein